MLGSERLEEWRLRQLARIERELGRRLLRIATPPGDFDPLGASPDALLKYGLPTPPDELAHPRAFRIWSQLVAKPEGAYQVGTWDLADLTVADYQVNASQIALRGRSESSRNWSGAVINARSGGTIHLVLGRWRVPAVTVSSGAADGLHICSTWIGLDGHRPLSRSLPQLGTSQIVPVTSGSPQPAKVEAWWQWWMRGHRNPPLRFRGFVVDFGDEVAAAAQLIAPDEVLLAVRNLTLNGPVFRVRVRAPDLVASLPTTPPAPIQLPIPARGFTAEWIAERPTVWGAADLHPLPDFTRVTFTDCAAIELPAIRGLRAPRLIRMTEARRGHSVVLARPRKVDDNEVVVTYDA